MPYELRTIERYLASRPTVPDRAVRDLVLNDPALRAKYETVQSLRKYAIERRQWADQQAEAERARWTTLRDEKEKELGSVVTAAQSAYEALGIPVPDPTLDAVEGAWPTAEEALIRHTTATQILDRDRRAVEETEASNRGLVTVSPVDPILEVGRRLRSKLEDARRLQSEIASYETRIGQIDPYDIDEQTLSWEVEFAGRGLLQMPDEEGPPVLDPALAARLAPDLDAAAQQNGDRS